MLFGSLLEISILVGLSIAAPQFDTFDNSEDQGPHLIFHQHEPRVRQPFPVQLAATYIKYKAIVPQDVQAAASRSLNTTTTSSEHQLQDAKRSSFNSTLTVNPDGNDSEYLCSVKVGGQKFHVDFDTGSSDFWLFSSELPTSDQKGHNIYQPQNSATQKKLNGQSWVLQYGDGSQANGDVYKDTVQLGTLKITSQAVGVARNISTVFQRDTNIDGVMGLAFKELSNIVPTKQNTIIDNAIGQGLSKAVFSADLKKGVPGSYTFGYVNASQYIGNISYTPVDSSGGHWQITASGYGVGKTYTPDTLTGVVDTGSSLLMLPSSVNTDYYNQVFGAVYDPVWGAYTFPCSSTLPSFVLGFGSNRFTLPGNYLNYGVLSDGTGRCYGGLQSSDSLGYNVIGDIFLKGFFVVFDRSKTPPRIGFASKNL